MQINQAQVAAQNTYKIHKIDSSSGILFQNLGLAKVSNQKFTILSYYNLTHISYSVNTLYHYYMQSLGYCS